MDFVDNFKQLEESKIKAKQILAVEDRCLMLTQDTYDFYVWGGNERG